MAAPEQPRPAQKSAPEVAQELWAMLRDYGRQQTIDPLKDLGRFVAFGAAGSVALGIGIVLLVVGLLRVLQTETGDVFDGNWTWVPYLITVVVLAALAALAVRAITKKPKGNT